MNVSCNKCGKRYVIADDKIAGKTTVKIRCKQCQSLIAVAVSVSASAPAAVTAAPTTGVRAAVQASAPAARAAAAQHFQWEEENTKAMPAMDLSATWYAMIHGKQTGPMGMRDLMLKVQAGEITLRTYLWKPGMGDWKRSADVPEVSPVFAGVSVGAPAQPARPKVPSKPVPAVQRDVAVANEVPAPELTHKPAGKGNGNGNGHGAHAQVQPPKPPPKTGVHAPATRRTGMYGVATPIVADPAPAPAPEPVQAAPEPAAAQQQAQPLNDLFGDLPQSNPNPTGTTQDDLPQADGALQDPNTEPKSDKFDPFSSLAPPSQSELPPPGEATRFFIAQAGLNKRNPPWKIALFAASLVAIPTAALYLLSTLHIVQLPTVTRTTDDGREVQESFFSTGGISGLKDALTGDAKRKREEAEQRRLALAAEHAAQPKHAVVPKPDKPEEVPVPKKVDPNLAAFYGENGEGKPHVPKNRHDDGTTTQVNSAGLSQESVSRVVADKQKAFQACIDAALRRNPGLAVGSITVVLNVGPSGAVKSASVEPKQHEGADWAQCMMGAGKRIMFPSSDGETQVELPFKVGVAL